MNGARSDRGYQKSDISEQEPKKRCDRFPASCSLFTARPLPAATKRAQAEACATGRRRDSLERENTRAEYDVDLVPGEPSQRGYRDDPERPEQAALLLKRETH